MRYLTQTELDAALSLRDLTDPAAGEHCMQQLVDAVADRLGALWGMPATTWRGKRIVTVADNYDRLGYPDDGAARDSRYTRYVDERRLLRTQMSAVVPSALRALAGDPRPAALLCPGIVYRRDVIDRLHVGEPHQLDIWQVMPHATGRDELMAMITAMLDALTPGRAWRVADAEHPYTLDGLEIEVDHHGQWVEIAECGLAHPDVLAAAGLDGWSGLAMGVGLDRAVMLRKDIDDIRLLRNTDPRVAEQMLDLDAYRPVSVQPYARRDVSVALPADWTAEQIGDQVRDVLGDACEWVEEIIVLSRTPAGELPEAAARRLGIVEGQDNALVKVLLRHPTRTLPKPEANALRDRIYDALHHGTEHHWIGGE